MSLSFSPRRVKVGAGALRVLEAGHGTPLVYLHGVGDNGEAFPVLARLAEHYRVIRPDHPGFIESDDLGAGSVGEIAEIEERLLDALGVDRFVLIGCSFGGWVAAELALRAGERVERLVLIDPVGLRGPEQGPDMFAMAPDELLRATVFDEERRAAAAAAPPPAHIAARLARSRAEALRLGRDPYMHDPDLAARLAALEVDTLVVWGAQDGVVPPSYGREWLAAVRGCRLELIEDAGHLPQIERPERFLQVTGLLPAEAA